MIARRAFAGLVVAASGACAAQAPAPAHEELRPRTVRIVAVHPHDATAFTQGLQFADGQLYESLGLEGRSSLRAVEIATGRVLREARLERSEFGEGIALVGERIVQLTWRNGVARLWRRSDFAPLGTLRYEGEGWGLALDRDRLVMSDGSARLTFRSPASFAVTGTLDVTRAGAAQPYLNELEVVDGALYANIWMSDEIVRIDLATGRVNAVWSAAGLLAPEEASAANILNGIAWNPVTRRFYLTGKLWPSLFEVELE